MGFRSKHGCSGSTRFCSTRSHSSTPADHRLRIRIRIGVLKGVGIQHPFHNVFEGCAVSDPVGNVEAAVLWHRTVPFSSAEGQQANGNRDRQPPPFGVLHPAGVLVRHNNNPSRREVATIPCWVKPLTTAEAGHGREPHLGLKASTQGSPSTQKTKGAPCWRSTRLRGVDTEQLAAEHHGVSRSDQRSLPDLPVPLAIVLAMDLEGSDFSLLS